MRISIIDYGMGNLRSVSKAFELLDYETERVDTPQKILKADKIILPGVGAFGDAMHHLKENGMDEAIKEAVRKGTPLMGICLGMQLLFEKGFEHGIHEGLGLLTGEIVRFDNPLYDKETEQLLKVPHMGWNKLEVTKKDPLFQQIPSDPYVYFVHSYYLKTQADIVSAYTHYGDKIAVAVQHQNVFATQFHPEKSGTIGLQILKNFGGIK